MKKFFALILAVAMLCTLCACGQKPVDNNGDNNNQTPATLKFGAAVYIPALTGSDATEEKNGAGQIDITMAAVSIDADGKIVDVAIDTAQNKIAFTLDGKAIANDGFKTKYELGAAYNMKPASPIGKEWNEQMDAFRALIKGKTLAEVKALVGEGNKGTDEVVNAGCTMKIADYVGAVEKAFAAAKDSNVTANDKVKVTAVSAQSVADATADAAGKSQVDTTIFFSAVNAEGKVVACVTDCVQAKFAFDAAGKSTTDTAAAVKSKLELGDAYNMKPASPIGKEWFEQAAAFDSLCIGKTATEIQALLADGGKGTEDVINAGCTMKIGDMVAAAAKI